MKTNKKINSKYISFLTVIVFGLLSACDISVPSSSSSTTPSSPTPEAPAKDTENVPDPLANTPVDPASFCVSQDLRDVYAIPIPYGASALYVVLVHEGVSGRVADPKCLTSHAVTSGGKTYIPCSVNIAEGAIYTRTWQDADRDWVKLALEREAEVQSLFSDASVQVSVQTNIGASSVFANDAALQGKSAVVLELKDGVTFSGFCQ